MNVNLYLRKFTLKKEKKRHALDTDSFELQTKNWNDRRLCKKHVLHSSFACVSGVVYVTERGEKLTFEFGESSGKLGLKMTNTTHTDERKMVWLSNSVPGYVISNIDYIYQSENGRMVGWVSTSYRSRTLLWLLRRSGATTHDFLGAQPKI